MLNRPSFPGLWDFFVCSNSVSKILNLFSWEASVQVPDGRGPEPLHRSLTSWALLSVLNAMAIRRSFNNSLNVGFE